MSASEPNAEGWYQDPFGEHEARWFSDGTPTALVRDGSVEAHEAPPAEHWEGPLESLEVSGAAPASLRRADDAEALGGDDSRSPTDAAFGSFSRTGLGMPIADLPPEDRRKPSRFRRWWRGQDD